MRNRVILFINVLLYSSITLLFSGVVFAENGTLGTDGEEIEPLTDDDKERAKKHFISGNNEFTEGRYLEAIDHFNVTYDITHSPEILYNIGRCYEELERPEKAVEYYEMYLRLDSEADDTDDVKERIRKLGGHEENTEDDLETDEADEKEESFESLGIKLVMQLGGSGILTGEEGWKKRVYVPLDVLIHFPVLDWLSLSGLFTYGTYMERGKLFMPSDPRSQVGLGVGASAIKHIKGRFSLIGRLLFVPTWVRRDRHKTAVWLNFQGAVGTEARIYGSWSAILEIVGGFGPVVIPAREIIDGGTWHDPVLPVADVGARIGAVYTF